MRFQNRRIILLLDNFAGHDLKGSYEPTNILIAFFAPNMTSLVQPLDAGIIRCLKAWYKKAFCMRALERDDADDPDIYKIAIKEAMMMVVEAWNAVSSETIINCWNHTRIQPAPVVLRIRASDVRMERAWRLVIEFATTESSMTLPEVEVKLMEALKEDYLETDWSPVLAAIMPAENDAAVATAAVQKFRHAAHPPGHDLQSKAALPELELLEDELMESVKKLKAQRRIFGIPPTIDQILSPPEEDEIGQQQYILQDDEAIIQKVLKEEAVSRGEIVEGESDETESEGSDEGEPEEVLSVREILELSVRLEKVSIRTDAKSALEVSRSLRRFRGELNSLQMRKARQVTLTSFWGDVTGDK
jgi:hypothetical protein